MTETTCPLAYVPVPANLLPQALHALAELMAPGPAELGSPAADSESSLSGTVHDQLGPNGHGWTDDVLRRLASTDSSTTNLVSRLLDELAAAPDEYLPTSVLVERLDVSQPQLRGVLGALTRHLKKHYGLGWPMDAEWGPDLGEGYETYYKVNHEVAEAWQHARTSE